MNCRESLSFSHCPKLYQSWSSDSAFLPSNILRRRLIHPKAKTPQYEQSNVVYALWCPHKVADLHICATIEPLHRRMVHHRRANSSGQDSTVNLHLKVGGLSSEWQKCSCFGQGTMMIWKGKYGISTQLFRTEETSRISGETNKTK